MELKIFELRFNGGIMYRVLSKNRTGQELVKKLGQSDVVSIEKEQKFTKYLYCDQLVEVQEIEQSDSIARDAWRLTE